MRISKRYDRPLVWQIRDRDYEDDDYSAHVWRDWLRCKAKVTANSPSDQVAAGVVTDTVTSHTIEIPWRTEYRDNWDNLCEMRLWDYTLGRLYAVIGVTGGARDRQIVVLAKEVAAFDADPVESPINSVQP